MTIETATAARQDDAGKRNVMHAMHTVYDDNDGYKPGDSVMCESGMYVVHPRGHSTYYVLLISSEAKMPWMPSIHPDLYGNEKCLLHPA